MVYEDNYRCLSCGAWGKTGDLLKRLNRTVIKYKSEDDHDQPNPFSRWLKNNTLSNVLRCSWAFVNAHPEYGGYFSHRGIENRFRYALGLGYMEGWYTVPIQNRHGKIIGAVARIDPAIGGRRKYMQPHGQSSLMLYCPNWRLIERGRVVVVTFGIFDAVTLAINGVAALSSLTGKATNPALFDQFRKRIYIFPDKGEEMEGRKLKSKLDWCKGIIEPEWPNECKDVNDIWIKYPQLLLDMIQEYKV